MHTHSVLFNIAIRFLIDVFPVIGVGVTDDGGVDGVDVDVVHAELLLQLGRRTLRKWP